MKVSKVLKGNLDGKDVFLYQLCADNGTSICLTNIGGTVTSIKTADRNGKMGEITLGFDDPMTYADPEYLSCGFYLGATIGRFANRIAGGKFTLNGKTDFSVITDEEADDIVEFLTESDECSETYELHMQKKAWKNQFNIYRPSL